MKIYSTKFKNLKIIKLKRFNDLRGDNVKIFNKKYKKLNFNFYESYVSISKKGSVRGLHGQLGKFSQSKLIYCIKGKVLDVAIDLRKNSQTYGQVFKKIITDKELTAILIPTGFAHGVIALENDTIIVNFNSTDYNPKKEFGININSINLKIPKMRLILSNKDKKLIDLKKFINKRK
tara:strand:+ start:2139 stop:2669 length:531 start_codon:yes stop_codon:yes gene_type:complete